MVDRIASEYSMPPCDVRRMPLAQVLCYDAAILARRGAQIGGPSFAEQDLLNQF